VQLQFDRLKKADQNEVLNAADQLVSGIRRFSSENRGTAKTQLGPRSALELIYELGRLVQRHAKRIDRHYGKGK
jgi:hypothetical protein